MRPFWKESGLGQLERRGKETKQSRGLQKTKLGRNTAGGFRLVHQLVGTLKTTHCVISVFHDSEELIPSMFSLFSFFFSFKEPWPDANLATLAFE